MKRLNKIIYFIFTSSFIVHIFFIGSRILQPDIPNVRVYRSPLKDIEFPLIFKICAYQIKNENERYKRAGYENYPAFYRGESMYNETLVGWGGHSQNFSNLGPVKGKEQALLNTIPAQSFGLNLKKTQFN